MRPRTALGITNFRFQIPILCVSAIFTATMMPAADRGHPHAAPHTPLALACQRAKADFHPITPADVAEAKAALVAALGRLDEKLTAAAANGAGWRAYLHLDLLNKLLASGKKPDLVRLSGIYKFFTRRYEGLELAWFLDVRHALDEYITMADSIGDRELISDYRERLDGLARALEAYEAKPTAENALVISQSVKWLQDERQAPALIAAIQKRFVHPNVFGQASAELVASGIVESVDEVTQVNDCILGTSVSGPAHTVGRTTAALVPNSEMGVIDTLFSGRAHGDSVGYHQPVTIFSNSETSLASCKRVWINQDGLFSLPAGANAETRTNVCDIQSRRGRGMVQRMAWKRSAEQQPAAESVAARHAEQRLDERIDKQVTESLDRTNRQYQEKYRQPFRDRNLFPQFLHFSTTDQVLSVVGLQAGGGKVAAPPRPRRRWEGPT